MKSGLILLPEPRIITDPQELRLTVDPSPEEVATYRESNMTVECVCGLQHIYESCGGCYFSGRHVHVVCSTTGDRRVLYDSV